ncbi:hypothetical protein G6F56_005425 [Rhizopus delemar]|nr:hypothetical protein G6F56_005425 [Rhizopus delemar]
MYADEDIIEDQFQIIQEESIKALEQVQLYQRKVMTPIWEKRREIVKSIPNFWSTAIGNCTLFSEDISENDQKALDSLTDFHVEYNENNPKQCKITATFGKNDVFKNETLTKEMIIDHEEGGSVISKATIEYYGEKSAPNEDAAGISFIGWFEDDSFEAGIILSDEVFPDAVSYFKGEGGIDPDFIDFESGDEEDEDEE